MSNLEDRVVEWAEKELNKKVDKKNILSLLFSKNGHLYVKLFSLMVENFKSKSRCKDVTSKLELMEEISKRDQLKNQLDLLKNQIAIKTLNIEKNQNIAKHCESKRQNINKRKIFLTLLIQVLEKIISFRDQFSKIPESTLHELQTMLIESSFSLENLINEEINNDKLNQENINLPELIDQINCLVQEINNSLYELSNFCPMMAEKFIFDSSLIDSFVNNSCSSFDKNEAEKREKSQSFKPEDEISLGLSVLELVDLCEQKKTEQEEKLLIKLNKMSSKIQKVLDK